MLQAHADPADQILQVVSAGCPDRIARVNDLLGHPPAEDCLSAQQKAYVADILVQLLENPKIFAGAWALCVFYASLVQHYCDAKLGTALLIRAFYASHDRSLREQLFVNIQAFCFAHNISLTAEIWQMYFALCDDWFGGHALAQVSFSPQPRHAILLASQVLLPPHQPSVNVMAMEKILAQDFGYDVVVLNSCEHPHDCTLPIFTRIKYARVPEFRGFQYDKAMGLQMFSPEAEMPSLQGYAELCAFVQVWKPEFILSFGSFNFSAEYLGQFCPVIAMQAGTDFVPTHSAKYLVTFRDLTAADERLLTQSGMENIPRLRTSYSYDPPDLSRPFAREDYDLSAEDVVCAVVGTRLAAELDEKNLALMEDVLAQDARIRIIFIGHLEPEDQARIRRRLGEDRLRFTGHILHVPSFLAHIADCYLNPERVGGGGSAAYALAAGVPVFTLNVGHVAANTHPDFVFPSLAALCAALKRFAGGEGRAELAAKARARFGEINSRKRMIGDILAGAGLLH